MVLSSTSGDKVISFYAITSLDVAVMSHGSARCVTSCSATTCTATTSSPGSLKRVPALHTVDKLLPWNTLRSKLCFVTFWTFKLIFSMKTLVWPLCVHAARSGQNLPNDRFIPISLPYVLVFSWIILDNFSHRRYQEHCVSAVVEGFADSSMQCSLISAIDFIYQQKS